MSKNTSSKIELPAYGIGIYDSINLKKKLFSAESDRDSDSDNDRPFSNLGWAGRCSRVANQRLGVALQANAEFGHVCDNMIASAHATP